MKKTIITIFLLGLLIPTALALENETQPIDNTGITEDIGITPDKPFLYGIDRALDSVRLALTFNEDKKAELGLEIAEERLLEAKKMALENKTEYLDKAINRYQKRMNEVNKRMERITKKQVTKKRLQTFMRIQSKTEELGMNIEDLNQTLVLRGIKTTLRNKLQNVSNTQATTYNRIRTHTEKILEEEVNTGVITQEEAEKFLTNKEKILAEKTINKTQERIEKTQEIIQKYPEKYNGTNAQEFLTKAMQKIEESKELYNNEDYENATKTAFEAKFIIDHIRTGVKIDRVLNHASAMKTRIRTNIPRQLVKDITDTNRNRNQKRYNNTTGDNTTGDNTNNTTGNNINNTRGNNTIGSNTNNTIGNNINNTRGNNTTGSNTNNTIGTMQITQ